MRIHSPPARPALALLFAALLAASACGGDGPASPAEQLSERRETEHFVFHYAAGDQVYSDWQEAYHAWLLSTWNVALTRKIEYFKYRDRAHKRSVMGVDGNGIAYPDRYEVHTIWPNDNHETVHVVVIAAIGSGPAFFDEGVAVAFHVDPVAGNLVPRWGNRSVHDIAREMWQQGRVPPLEQLIASESSFRGFEDGLSYPLAGSFVRFLVDTRGLETVKRIFREMRRADGGAAVRTKFRAIFGAELDAVWDEWRLYVTTGAAPA
ncbi:MAG TPA: hypothetical protein VF746_17075 [Longimicrobium sp.]|jgi:hypothetical protein